MTLHYRAKLDDGTIVEDTFEGDALAYVHGSGRILPGLERGLAGKGAGDLCEIVVEPEFGYGERDPAADQPVERSRFPSGVELVAGMEFRAQGPQGAQRVWVKAVDEHDVIVTSNHPLSGERLTYEVRILEVRDAPDDSGAAPDT